MSHKPNPALGRNSDGKYPCTCTCGVEFWADAPHALYHSRECKLKARTERLHGREPLKRKGKKMNNCLGHGCNGKAYPPAHFCRKCKDIRVKNPNYADQWGAVI